MEILKNILKGIGIVTLLVAAGALFLVLLGESFSPAGGPVSSFLGEVVKAAYPQ